MNKRSQYESYLRSKPSANSEEAYLRNCEFWIWDKKIHEKLFDSTGGHCCFWHIVGLPEKEHVIGKDAIGKEILEKKIHPIHDYQKEWYDALQNNRYLWVKKATGMGATTFFLGYMTWLCLRNDDYKGSSMGVITGPRVNMAIEEISRIPKLFKNIEYTPETIRTRVTINECTIEAYPSHNLSAGRSLEKVRFWFVDEADFFPISMQKEARVVVERYEAKTHPIVVFNSTANLPGGLYEEMEREEPSQYTKVYSLDDKGIRDGMYSAYEIEQARRSLGYEREYRGKYGIGIGNIFPFIDMCVEKYDLKIKGGVKGLYVDPAYGSSKFGMVGIEKLDGILYVKEATQYDRPSPSAMAEVVKQKALFYDNYCKVDSAHPGLIKDLRDRNVICSDINFGKKVTDPDKEEGSKISQRALMTTISAQVAKEENVKINPIFTDLIAQLKSVIFDDKGGPDKKELTFDLGDAFMMGVYDLKYKDYTSISYGLDGKIIEDKKTKSKGLRVDTEVVE